MQRRRLRPRLTCAFPPALLSPQILGGDAFLRNGLAVLDSAPAPAASPGRRLQAAGDNAAMQAKYNVGWPQNLWVAPVPDEIEGEDAQNAFIARPPSPCTGCSRWKVDVRGKSAWINCQFGQRAPAPGASPTSGKRGTVLCTTTTFLPGYGAAEEYRRDAERAVSERQLQLEAESNQQWANGAAYAQSRCVPSGGPTPVSCDRNLNGALGVSCAPCYVTGGGTGNSGGGRDWDKIGNFFNNFFY